jgi:hypothetical protein
MTVSTLIKRTGIVPSTIARLILPLLTMIHAILLLLPVTRADAGEIEPRAYVNTPVGVNFLLAGYVYSDGELSTPGASPIKDAQVTMHTGILGYARSLDIFGKSGKVDIIAPYSDLSGTALVSGQPAERNVSGFLDPRARFSVNLHGAPALSLEEFAGYRQDLLIGASVQISAPLGQYDHDRLVNLGNNRWFIKPDIGISKAWGDFTLELSTGVTFYTDNDDFFGGKKQEQDPLYTGQFHATYNFGRGIWGAVSGTFDHGGRTTVNGVRSDDLQNNARNGITLALPINRNNSLKLYASTAVHTTVGNDFDLYGIIWQHRWGGGL